MIKKQIKRKNKKQQLQRVGHTPYHMLSEQDAINARSMDAKFGAIIETLTEKEFTESQLWIIREVVDDIDKFEIMLETFKKFFT